MSVAGLRGVTCWIEVGLVTRDNTTNERGRAEGPSWTPVSPTATSHICYPG